MAKKNESLIEMLVLFPWWVSAVLSVISYLTLKYYIPSINFQQKGPLDISYIFPKGAANAAPLFAPVVALFFLIPAVASAVRSRRKRQLLDKQESIDTILNLTWKEFEKLIGEAYRRKGYAVIENDGMGPDGGVDLILKKNGNLVLVQCKQWRTYKVDVRVVREMYGVMTAQRANSAIIVTAGSFTQEARNFAANKPIDLIERQELANLIESVQTSPVNSFARINNPQKPANVCQNCGGGLVLRTARRGKNAGNKFWGCSNYPKCKFTKSYTV